MRNQQSLIHKMKTAIAAPSIDRIGKLKWLKMHKELSIPNVIMKVDEYLSSGIKIKKITYRNNIKVSFLFLVITNCYLPWLWLV